ncbi:MAG: purine nucleoside permease, partial [Opitutales bacterium]
MSNASAESPIPVRVVVLHNFEIGEITGDVAGEFQHWYERGIANDGPLELVPLPHSWHADGYEPTRQVLETNTGLPDEPPHPSDMEITL